MFRTEFAWDLYTRMCVPVEEHLTRVWYYHTTRPRSAARRLWDRLMYATVRRWIIEYNFSRQDEAVMLHQRYDTPEKLSGTDAEVIQWRRLVVIGIAGEAAADVFERRPRQDRHTVEPLLPEEREIVAKVLERCARKAGVIALGLLEEDDVRADHGAATRTARRGADRVRLVGPSPLAAAHAHRVEDVAVDLDDVPRPRLLVEAVDVLGEEGEALGRALDLGEGEVGRVGLRALRHSRDRGDRVLDVAKKRLITWRPQPTS